MIATDIWQEIKPKTQTDSFVAFVKSDAFRTIGKDNLVKIAKNYAVTYFTVYDDCEITPPYTPMPLIKEMTDKLVGVDFSTAKFLVIYTVEWANYLQAIHGVPAANITVVGDSKRVEVAEWAGYNTMTPADFLSGVPDGDNDLKFDVVVGNPPFQDSNKKGSYNSLWSKFVIKSFDIINNHGIVTMITPCTWYTQPRLNSGNSISKVAKLIQNHATVVQVNGVNDFFAGVGSTFSYYVLTKKLSSVCFKNGKEIQSNNLFESLMSEGDVLVEKLLGFGTFTRSEKASSFGVVSETQTPECKYPVLISQNRVDYVETPGQHHNLKKAIFLVRTSYNTPVFDYLGNLSAPPGSTSSVYLFDTDIQLKNFELLFETTLYKFIIGSQRKHHGFLSSKTTSQIPLVDVNKSWSDPELYAHFDLTQEEIDYIEASVK